MSDPYDPQLTLQENAAKQQKLREEAEEIITLRARLETAKAALRTIAESNITSVALRNIARTELGLIEAAP